MLKRKGLRRADKLVLPERDLHGAIKAGVKGEEVYPILKGQCAGTER